MCHRFEHIFVVKYPYKAASLPNKKKYINNFLSKTKSKKYQTKANIERIKLDKTVTSRRQIRDCINASTIVFRPTKYTS